MNENLVIKSCIVNYGYFQVEPLRQLSSKLKAERVGLLNMGELGGPGVLSKILSLAGSGRLGFF
jgi:hypothetical protein